MSPRNKRAKILALTGAALATATATAAPAASAVPADSVPRSAQGVAKAPASDAAPIANAPSDGGFDLVSAGVGAAGGGLLVLALAGGGLALRRPATRDYGAASG